ncbi:hypothetical protein [Phaffia rhodozyma]|uniref:Uncharacterized protein n=1 Tax=Phaffia rhodozyma TaxID=264483 RepID=A0A0F7SPQ5_PHARH|nr:hypothetical protein [Phaffia rhodozyma]
MEPIEISSRAILQSLSSKIPTEFHLLLDRAPGPLNPKNPFDKSLTSRIDACTTLPLSALPALHLLNSDYSSAHLIAQAHEGELYGTFDYYHALVHRTEGHSEYWNAKWWFDRINHPVLVKAYPNSRGDVRTARTEAKKRVNVIQSLEGRVNLMEKVSKDEIRELCWQEICCLLEWSLNHPR